MLLGVTIPAGCDCDRGVLGAGLKSLAGLNSGRHSCTFSIHRTEGTTCFRVSCPPELRALTEAAIYAAAPAAHIEAVAEEPASTKPQWHAPLFALSDVRLDRFATNSDPLRILLAILERQNSDVECIIRYIVRPATRRERRRAARVERLIRTLSESWMHGYLVARCGSRVSRLFLDSLTAVAARCTPIKSGESQSRHELASFSASIVISVCSLPDEEARRLLRELSGALAVASADEFLAVAGKPRRGPPSRRPPKSVLTPESLAALWHLPSAGRDVSGVQTATHRELEPPAWMARHDDRPELAPLGEASFRGRARICGLLPDDRLRHLVVLGKTGTGKSTLLETLVSHDLTRDRGVGVIDPHGQLVEAILNRVPRHRTNDVVLFDAADISHPVGFNPLRCDRPQDRPLVAAGVLAAFKKLYPEFFGPRMEHVFRNALLACVSVPGLTLVDLQRLLCEASFRRSIVDRAADEAVRTFWLQEFASMPAKLQAEAVAPVQNKVGAFVANPVLRAIVGQSDAKLNLRQIMDRGRILLCNVSKGRIGEDASTLLGSMLVTSLQIAAMGRADVPEAERCDFFLTVDEFGSFATDGFASILSESRKYRLGLTAALQYLGQASPATRAALFGNVGSLLAFQCGPEDANTLAEQLSLPDPQDLVSVPRYHAYARLLVAGQPTPPFVLRTLPLPSDNVDTRRAAIVRRTSRRRYARQQAHNPRNESTRRDSVLQERSSMV